MLAPILEEKNLDKDSLEIAQTEGHLLFADPEIATLLEQEGFGPEDVVAVLQMNINEKLRQHFF